MADPNDISMPVAKATAAIASATGAQVIDAGAKAQSIFADLLVITWPNIASAAAALFSIACLLEFCWKKFWRPALERLGWIKPKVYLTPSQWADLMPYTPRNRRENRTDTP
ncbi:hypothetical protein [Variovorax sp. JS1663]|uniref:hypothetical protein n=1 Tax=Variovorax sp. JS1663 TaxID=1851577 RepID=UPI000B343936|nr:hypothetical protein [Variovorax sp. JS1663]OUM01741.1 hypothetical protein A8M77_14360 [Variovorax sp. JS1663]